jgi:hypothetical protein
VAELEQQVHRATTERRYEIVPLRQSIALFGRRPSIFREDR